MTTIDVGIREQIVATENKIKAGNKHIGYFPLSLLGNQPADPWRSLFTVVPLNGHIEVIKDQQSNQI